MIESKDIFKQATRWSVIGKEFKGVLDRFSVVADLDMSIHENQDQLEALFANYFSRLKSESARFDRSDARIYYQLSQICTPKIFRDPNYFGIQNALDLLIKPATNKDHPLYAIARETQSMVPGTVYLRDASRLFQPGEIPHSLHPAVVEYVIGTTGHKNQVARVPVILTGSPNSVNFIDNNIPILDRVIYVLQLTEAKVRVSVRHLPYLASKEKELVNITGEFPILDWPGAYPDGRIESPLVGTMSQSPGRDEDQTLFESITISAGEVSQSWAGASKGIFGTLIPSHDVWEYWSFNNTLYQIRNVATGNMLKQVKCLSKDILSLPDIQFDSGRTATLAVHLPMLLAAAYSEAIPKCIGEGIGARLNKQNDEESQRRELERRFWDNFVLE